MANDNRIIVSRTIDAPAPEIFDVLTLPSRHREIDGESRGALIRPSAFHVLCGGTLTSRGAAARWSTHANPS